MSELSGSSEIRDCLFDLDGDDDSDIVLEDGEEDFDNLTGYSSGSDDLCEPRLTMSDAENDTDDDLGHNELEIRETFDESNNDSHDSNVVEQTEPKWTRVYPPEPEIKVEEKFRVRNAGIRNCPPRNSPPLAYFYLFFTSAIWNILVSETNKYAHEIITNKTKSGKMRPYSRLQKWVDVTVSEMKKFISLIINMGLNRNNNIEKYWSTPKSQIIPFFSNIMSLNRFEMINSMLHISSQPYIPPGQPGHQHCFHKLQHYWRPMKAG